MDGPGTGTFTSHFMDLSASYTGTRRGADVTNHQPGHLELVIIPFSHAPDYLAP